MPTNVNTCQYISGKLTINIDKAEAFTKINRLAEGNFIEECLEDCDEDTKHVQVDNVEWYGERSGSTFSNYEKALSITTGSADILVIWEDGELEGIRVVDGKVTYHEVSIKLGEDVTHLRKP